MNRIFLSSGVWMVIAMLFLFNPLAANAQQAGAASVESASICTDVADREAVNAGTSFAVSIGRLYCFSKIADIKESSEIVHVWYFGDTERARVPLGVNPPSWRTYSSKIIQPHEIGSWRVDILDGSANLLHTLEFETTP